MEILCFYAGVALVYIKSIYAPGFVFVLLFIYRQWIFLVWFIAGMAIALSHSYWSADQLMPKAEVINQALIIADVESIPAVTPARTTSQLLIHVLNGQPVYAHASFSCYKNCPEMAAGQRWQLNVKLKAPHDLANPGSRHYVEALSAKHIHWLANFRPGPLTQRLADPPLEVNTVLLKIRAALSQRLGHLESNADVIGVFEAITLGLTAHISQQNWDLFRKTGTTHLMVISGSHIGLVAGLAFTAASFLWRRPRTFALYLPAVQVGSGFGFLMALTYTLISGYGLPSIRSLVGCLFLMIMRYWSSQRFTSWQAWRYGLFLVICSEPHAVFQTGFYLSFLAVAMLLLVSQRFSYCGWRQNLVLQLGCLFGLMPLTLYWFSYGAMNGLFANALAIPLVELLIVPLSLLSLLLICIIPSPWLIKPAALSIQALLYFLKAVNHLAMINVNYSIFDFSTIIALMLVLLIFVFIPLRSLQFLSVILLLSCFYPHKYSLESDSVRIDVLDVGQGLAVAIHTAEHVLIYDTGAKFFQGGDMALSVIIPYLKYHQVSHVDRIVISHPDLDHRGGLESLSAIYPADDLLIDNPGFYHQGRSCHDEPAWDWDGVHFEFLPIRLDLKDKNNSSCVLKVSARGGSVLLTGDIERPAERYLVEQYPQLLKADIFIVPHHGSKTSTTRAFLAQVHPKYAIISSGFDNRYHFPHLHTLDELKREGSKVFDTQSNGMVRIELGQAIKITPTLQHPL